MNQTVDYEFLNNLLYTSTHPSIRVFAIQKLVESKYPIPFDLQSAVHSYVKKTTHESEQLKRRNQLTHKLSLENSKYKYQCDLQDKLLSEFQRRLDHLDKTFIDVIGMLSYQTEKWIK